MPSRDLLKSEKQALGKKSRWRCSDEGPRPRPRGRTGKAQTLLLLQTSLWTKLLSATHYSWRMGIMLTPTSVSYEKHIS